MLREELAGCEVAFVDITERRRAEESLRESEEIYRAVADRYPGLERRTLEVRGKEQPLSVRVFRAWGYVEVSWREE